MQTSEEAQSFFINVISQEGIVLNISVTGEFTVEKVKLLAIEHFYGKNETKPATQFHLVHGILLKHLNDDKNLKEEKISESDELLLVSVRLPTEKLNLSEEALKGPTEEDVMKATKELPVRNPPKPLVTSDRPEQFQNEISKILITLVQTSAKILMYRPDAKQFYEIIKRKLEIQLKSVDNSKATKLLVEMGYSENKALKALRLTRMNISEALEWLFEHQDDSDDDEDTQSSLLDLLSDEQVDSNSSDNEYVKKEPSLLHIVNLLLGSFQRKVDFKPDPTLVESLEKMGFEKSKILETLKITRNNKAKACSWLLGERRSILENLYEGMDPDGPIYNAIMNNPQIQLSLTDPKMLFAYLSMLETFKSISIWLNDPHVSPILSQIFNTYNAEKHATYLNHYNNS